MSILFFAIFFLISFANSSVFAASLACDIKNSSQCGDTPVLYIQNDTGGYNNAHVQNVTNNSFFRYNYTLCCSSPDTLGYSCNESVDSSSVFLRLSNETNSHVQVDNYNGSGANYKVYACLSANTGTMSCIFRNNSCPSEYTCLGTIASTESSDNLTNAHYSACGVYNVTICCKITDPPAPISPPTQSEGGGGAAITTKTGTEKIPIKISANDVSIAVVKSSNKETYGGLISSSREVIELENLLNKTIKVDVEVVGLDGIFIFLDDELIDFLNKTNSIKAISDEANNKKTEFEVLDVIPLVSAAEEVKSRFIKEIVLAPGERKKLFVVAGPEAKGLLTGKILLKTEGHVEEVRIVINVKTDNFLFDSSLLIPENLKKITAGKKLKVQVNLIEVGRQKEKVDVTANYVIKDYEGSIYHQESETFFVLSEKNFVKEFPTDGMKAGKYLVGLEIIYPGAFATSSTQFEIVEKEEVEVEPKKLPIVIAIIAVVLVISIIIWVFLEKFLAKKDKEEYQNVV